VKRHLAPKDEGMIKCALKEEVRIVFALFCANLNCITRDARLRRPIEASRSPKFGGKH